MESEKDMKDIFSDEDLDLSFKVVKKQKVEIDSVKTQINLEQQNIIQISEIQQTHIDYEEKKPGDFYEKKAEITDIGRSLLRTAPLRIFNGWVKSVLIKKYSELAKSQLRVEKNIQIVDNYLSVLELGFGRGGDIKKWQLSSVGCIVGVDISLNSLKDAFKRVQKSFKNRQFGIRLIEESATQDTNKLFEKIDYHKYDQKSKQLIKQQMYFDIVSVQFCAHYFFDAEKSTRSFFSNITSRLLKNGYVIMTIPDACVIVKKMRHKGQKTDQGYVYENKYFSLFFKDILFPNSQVYGLEYGFYLEDAVGEKKENKINYVNENLIEINNFIDLSREYGLKLIENQNFIEFFHSNVEQYKDLLSSKLNFKENEVIEPDLWEVVHCYRIVVMQNIGLNQNMGSYNRIAVKDIKNSKNEGVFQNLDSKPIN